MNPRYSTIAARAFHNCEYCHAPESVFNFPFEVDHVIPVSSEGKDTEENLALACRSCNIYKAAFLDGVDPETLDSALLFNPRMQIWKEHFSVNEQTGEIVGLSPIGRATVNRLRMNSKAQIVARKQWMLIGLFP